MPVVHLFATCLVDTFYPETGQAIVDILRRLGVRVEFPVGQTCCGQPAYNAGLREAARPLAEQTIKVFEAAPGAVVVPSGSCAVMLKDG
ncbi:MAG: (Fe-S)-binding protein, partial [Chloroflexi bacterium]|nr:(Fe-S)-binding protein [Chloroflexota bacterium]